MSVCFKCSATTDNHCSICGAYVCETCWAATKSGIKDRIKGERACSNDVGGAISDVLNLVDTDILPGVIQVIPEDPPE